MGKNSQQERVGDTGSNKTISKKKVGVLANGFFRYSFFVLFSHCSQYTYSCTSAVIHARNGEVILLYASLNMHDFFSWYKIPYLPKKEENDIYSIHKVNLMC